MASYNRWIFTESQLNNTPSRKCGLDSEEESTYRYQAGTLIRDIGHKLQVTQLCINTAIVYMHRFYMYHSFRNTSYKRVAPACIFLAAKVEEQPRKLEHVIRTTYTCLNRDPPNFDTKSETYSTMSQEINTYETILLMTLGFDTTVEHPHTIIVRTCSMIKASKDFAQSAYFLATSSLLMTTMCLRYPTSVVACVCIHVACRWSSFEIPQSTEGKAWYTYIEPSVTPESLEEMTKQFCAALDKFPNKFRRKVANNKVTAEDMGQQEKKLNFEMPTALPTQEIKIKGVPTAAVMAPSSVPFAPASSRSKPDLMPVWNTLKPQPEAALGSATSQIPSAGKPAFAEQPVKNEKEALTGTSAAVSTTDPALRRVKTESTLTTSLSAKDYMERRRLEQKRVEEERHRLQVEMEKREIADTGSAGVKQEKDLDQEIHPTEPGKVDSRDNFFSKLKREPKTEKKSEFLGSDVDSVSLNQKAEGVKDGLEIDSILKPEHIYGSSNLKLSTSTLSHKLPPTTTPQQPLDQNHRPGNALGSRLSLPMPPFSGGQNNKDSNQERHRMKEKASRDQLAMGDASSRKEASNALVNATNVNERKGSEVSSHLTVKPNSDLALHAGSASFMEASAKKHHHKKDRSHHRSREDRERSREESDRLKEAPGPANAPLKLKIPIPTTPAGNSPPKRHSDPGELKLKIKSPAMASQSKTEQIPETTDGFKFKISLKGQSGRVEAVGSDRHSSNVLPSLVHDGSSSQAASLKNSGGSSTSHGMKLVLSKDRISGEYQHGLSSHHEEQRHHHHRNRRHHSKTEAEKNDYGHKRSASPLPPESQRHKIPRLSSEADRSYGNGNQSSNRITNTYSGTYSQQQNYPVGPQQPYPPHLLAPPYQMVQPPPPPPLPNEPAPSPPPLPPC